MGVKIQKNLGERLSPAHINITALFQRFKIYKKNNKNHLPTKIQTLLSRKASSNSFKSQLYSKKKKENSKNKSKASFRTFEA